MCFIDALHCEKKINSSYSTMNLKRRNMRSSNSVWLHLKMSLIWEKSDPRSCCYDYMSLVGPRCMYDHVPHTLTSWGAGNVMSGQIPQRRLVPLRTQEGKRSSAIFQQRSMSGPRRSLLTPPLAASVQGFKFSPPKFRVDLLSNQAPSVWLIAIQHSGWFICRM